MSVNLTVDISLPLDNQTNDLLFLELEYRLSQLPKTGTLIIMRDVPDRVSLKYMPYKIQTFQNVCGKSWTQQACPILFSLAFIKVVKRSVETVI